MSIEDYALELGVDTKTVISKLKELCNKILYEYHYNFITLRKPTVVTVYRG